jgi:hypothetical protein
MRLVTWRNTALVLAFVCVYQRWQGCSHGDAPGEPSAPAGDTRRVAVTPASPAPTSATAAPALPTLPGAASTSSAAGGISFRGFHIPAWALHLAPQRGETLRAYRDRMLPLAELAIAPQRARVARMRDDFAALDPHQRAELDAAVGDAAKAIQARVTAALVAGELRPATLKPMTGVGLARDVLDIVDRGNTRFINTLTPDQRTQLASHRFDFADYLLFSTHWEDALHALD